MGKGLSRLRRHVQPFVLALLVSACATATNDATSTTTTAGAVTTTGPTTTSAGEPITLVAIGDSFVAWSDWPAMYADLAETRLGRAVEHNPTLAGAGTGPRLPWLDGNEEAQDAIAGAQLIVIQPQPGWIAEPMFSAYLDGDCGGAANTDCFAATVDAYREYMDDYLDLIVDLAPPAAVMRVVLTGSWARDGFYPGLRQDRPDDFAAIGEGLRLLMAEAAGAAADRGIPVVDVNLAFNGPDYRLPTPEGYLVADQIHLAEAGSEVVAQLLDDLGYDPAGPTTVTFDGSSCDLDGPLSLPSGLNEFHIVNTSGQTGNIVLAHLVDGSTADDLTSALEESNSQPEFVDDAVLSHLPNGGDVGLTKTVSYNLTAGNWAVVCSTNLPAQTWVVTEIIVVG